MNTQSHHPIHIKLLPEFLINRIKAGEIIERPSNLIKELVENSIDAEANKIEIHLIGNGLKQITIKDNGAGIPFSDLPYAFCRHATSKIENFQDLFRLHSFGFRGEALASIAAVSQITCQSRYRDEERGGQISLSGGITEDPIPHEGLPQGTSLNIKDLFFNTPVRLNFIRSQHTEKISLQHVLNSFFISHPEIEFHLKWDKDEKTILRPTNRFERFINTLGKKKENNKEFYVAQKSRENYHFYGVYSKIPKKSGQSKNQYIFVNKRLIQDKILHRVISSALKEYWPTGTSAPYLIDLQVPSNELDVNIHPNKTIVKFANPSMIQSLVHSTLKEELNKQDKNRDDLKNPNLRSYQDREECPTSISINQQYRILHQQKSFPILVDGYTLLQFHLDTIKEQFHSEEQSTLLVAIPFRDPNVVSKIKNHQLDQFEFEIIKDNLAILRSIPSSLALFPHRACVFYLLDEEECFEQEINADPLPIKTIYELVAKYSAQLLLENKIMAILTPESVSNILQ